MAGRPMGTIAGVNPGQGRLDLSFHSFFRAIPCIQLRHRAKYHPAGDAIHHSDFVQHGNGMIVRPWKVIWQK
ncbi:hypothetical protein D3C85_1809730 [compost metagenome]